MTRKKKPKPIEPDLTIPRLLTQPQPDKPAEQIQLIHIAKSIPEPVHPGVEIDLSAYQEQQLHLLISEHARRQIEGLRLYEPLPLQQAFHACLARERIIRGSNRAGKTLGAAAEVARAVCGCDPFNKYPKEDGRFYVVARDEKEIGSVIWRKLAKPGAFRIIRDIDTGLWRAWRPWELADALREKQTKPAPPLIPKRLIKSIGWEKRVLEVPAVVRLATGWEISFFSANSRPPTGADIDGGWFDEEVAEHWYAEIAARLTDRRGRFIWSATPQAATERLFELHEKAVLQSGSLNPAIVEFHAKIDDNAFMTQEAKDEFKSKLSGADYQVRVQGEFALLSFRVFPEYDPAKHVVPWFEIPRDWTRYAFIDPGVQVCAVLFAAVPPRKDGDGVYIYDELYLERANAAEFALAMKQKIGDQTMQAFVIDHHGGRLTDIGAGKTVEQQYSEELKKQGVKSIETGCDFHWASDDIKAGELAVHGWLAEREDGTRKLRILSDRCPYLDREFRRYHRKRDTKGNVKDEPEQRNIHLMDDVRYLALYNPKWVAPPEKKKRESDVTRYLRMKRERERARDGPQFISLGPGA